MKMSHKPARPARAGVGASEKNASRKTAKSSSKAKVLKPDFAEVMKFKKFFHHDDPALFQTFPRKGEGGGAHGEVFSGCINNSTKNRITSACENHHHVAMAINTVSGAKRTKENVTKINAVFIDADNQSWTFDKLMALACPPHMVVESSKGNFHAYWRVTDCTTGQFHRVQKALATKLGTDQSVSDRCRAMRLAGTFNVKYNPSFLARIVHTAKDTKLITVQELVEKLSLDLNPTGGPLNKTPSASRATNGEYSIDQITTALANVQSDLRQDWLTVGMALNNYDASQTGFELWDCWSRTTSSSNYAQANQKSTWNNFKPDGGVTIQTLFYMSAARAKKDGNQWNEESLAAEFAKTYKGGLRFENKARTWYFFDGTMWKVDEQAPLIRVKQMIEGLRTQTKNKDALAVLSANCSVARFRAIVSHAELLSEIHVHADEFDSNANLLAVQNGVVDLLTGKHRAAIASDMLTRQAAVTFDPNASCPTWTAFLRGITCEDQAYSQHLRRAVGYSLFGHAREQAFFLQIGSGSNGKGVFSRVIKKILGAYGVAVTPTVMTRAYSAGPNSPTPALVALQGARFAICTELPTNGTFDEAFVKQFAGGDDISARAPYGGIITFKPEGKLWVSTNHAPEIEHDDIAMWRRMKVLPFRRQFEGQEVDHTLEEKLAQEHSGILNWMLKGAADYLKSGLGTCSAVESEEGTMRSQADSVYAWFRECCRAREDQRTQSAVAYDSYAKYTRRAKRTPLSNPEFGKVLEGRGHKRFRTKDANFFRGFRLLD